MKTWFTTVSTLAIMILSVSAAADIRVTDCGMYGPDETNLAVVIDEENASEVLLVGYEILGNFFELRLTGCSDLTIDGSSLLCDGQRVGSVGKTGIADEDPGFEGPRASVRLDFRKYDLTGSCRNRRLSPLTLTIKPKA